MTNYENTIINHDIGRPVIGYMVNATFDDNCKQIIESIQDALNKEFEDSIWLTPLDSLHITLLDWIAPLVDYGNDKTALFQDHFDQYDIALQNALENIGPISLKFDTIKATAGAVIVTASDNSALDAIRQHVLSHVKLLEGTKQPPKITHSSIARYKKAMPLEPVIRFVKNYHIDFSCSIQHFRLVREDVAPQLHYELLKEYPIV